MHPSPHTRAVWATAWCRRAGRVILSVRRLPFGVADRASPYQDIEDREDSAGTNCDLPPGGEVMSFDLRDVVVGDLGRDSFGGQHHKVKVPDSSDIALYLRTVTP